MNSTTIALVLFLAAMCGWMWWRIRRMPPSATQPPASSALPAMSTIQPAAVDEIDGADEIDAAYNLDLLGQVPAEYVGRADLEQVVLVNDDTTPMELVIFVLKNTFGLPLNAAYPAMLDAHTEGECVIAVLPAAVAAERIAATREIMEKIGGYPLQIVARPLPDEAGSPAAAPA